MKVKKISETFALANPQVIAEAVGKITELNEEASWQLTDSIIHMLQTSPYELGSKVKYKISFEENHSEALAGRIGSGEKCPKTPPQRVSASMTLQAFPEGKRLTFHFTKLGITNPPTILFIR